MDLRFQVGLIGFPKGTISVVLLDRLVLHSILGEVGTSGLPDFSSLCQDGEKHFWYIQVSNGLVKVFGLCADQLMSRYLIN